MTKLMHQKTHKQDVVTRELKLGREKKNIL
jgi:hypothetical protein